MSLLLHGDCLEHMKTLTDDSIDLIFCDLPYGQTSCKWDCLIDLDEFWKQIMRIKKTNTPIFFTCTTKFGVSLINSAPKKIPFRYDIIWVKSAPTGFLSAKKMPMRKHEMIYVFYEKLPFYDLSSHTHKFIKDKEKSSIIKQNQYNHNEEQIYNAEYLEKKVDFKGRNGGSMFEPPLPTTIVKEEVYNNGNRNGGFGGEQKGLGAIYQDPALISSQDVHKKNGLKSIGYEPPLPTTMLEIKSTKGKHSTEKPVALMEWVLKYYSKEGDVVLDPTMGSGSTGLACKNMKRNFIGIEMDDDIFEVAYKRLNEDECV